MDIELKKVMPIGNPQDYKIHLATRNLEGVEPLEDFVADRNNWDVWNTYRARAERDDFNRKYIFSLIDYHYDADTWLFGGIYQVLSRSKKQGDSSYRVKRIANFEEFVGRLKIHFHRPSRQRALLLEKHYDKLVVSEILSEMYSGAEFVGYENINHDFGQLESIIKLQKPKWKGALQNVKGIYLITDNKNGKRYVGSAYGDQGIWARWESYITTGHGGNKELIELIKEKGIPYARRNFSFALLEFRTMKEPDETIFARENYWKQVLLTRQSGYNRN